MGSVSDRGSKNGRFLRSLGFIDPGLSFAMLVDGSLQQDGALPTCLGVGFRIVSRDEDTLHYASPERLPLPS